MTLNKCKFSGVINYFLNYDAGKKLLSKDIYNKVENRKHCFENMLKK